MNNLTNLTVKDVYFNLLTPTPKRIAMEQDNDTYLATIALDNGIRLTAVSYTHLTLPTTPYV